MNFATCSDKRRVPISDGVPIGDGFRYRRTTRSSRRHRFAAEEVAQSLWEMVRAARKDSVPGQTAGVKNGIDDVADKLGRIAAFKAHSHVYRGFNRLRVGDFEQDNAVRIRERFEILIFEVVVSGRELDAKALLLEGAMEMLRAPLAIACKKNQWNRGCKIVGDNLFPVHEPLAAFLVYRMQGRKPLPRDVPKGQAEGQSP